LQAIAIFGINSNSWSKYALKDPETRHEPKKKLTILFDFFNMQQLLLNFSWGLCIVGYGIKTEVSSG